MLPLIPIIIGIGSLFLESCGGKNGTPPANDPDSARDSKDKKNADSKSYQTCADPSVDVYPPCIECFPENQSSSILNDTDTIRVAMILNRDSRLPDEQQLHEAMRLANNRLEIVTGKKLLLTERCYGRFGRYEEAHPENSNAYDMLSTYIVRTQRPFPDYLVVVTTNQMSSTSGGYTLARYGWLPEDEARLRRREPDFCQRVASEVWDNKPMIYASVVHGIEIFAGGCGYARDEFGEWILTGQMSTYLNGNCRNPDPVRCAVRDNTSICPDQINNPLATIPGMMAHTIDHELAHNFGSNIDHFGTEECIKRVGVERLEQTSFETYFGICPDVVDRLAESGPACFSE